MQLLVLRIALHARLVEIYFDSFRNGGISGEDSPTFGHANAFLCSFIDSIRNRFLKKRIM